MGQGAGSISILNKGNIFAKGTGDADAYSGIDVQTDGAATVSTRNDGNIAATTHGIMIETNQDALVSAESISIINTGHISGDPNFGIFVTPTLGSGIFALANGPGTIDGFNSGYIYGDAAVELTSLGGGTLNFLNTGNLDAVGVFGGDGNPTGVGIFARTQGGNGNVNLANAGKIGFSAPVTGNGIYAQVDETGSGSISVLNGFDTVNNVPVTTASIFSQGNGIRAVNGSAVTGLGGSGTISISNYAGPNTGGPFGGAGASATAGIFGRPERQRLLGHLGAAARDGQRRHLECRDGAGRRL